MASTYSDLLGIENQATGENSATWGDIVDSNFELLEDAIAGRLSKSVAGSTDVTLTDNDGASDESRNMLMEFTGTLTGNINVVVPTSSKLYFLHNNTSGSFTLTVKTAAGAGVVLTQGGKDALICDGTNVVRAVDTTSYTHPSGDGNSHVPADSGSNNGKVLTATATTGAPIWSDVPTEVPSQTGESGKYLKTDGTSATWEDAVSKTSPTGSGALPSGTTAQRDASPVAGYIRFNSETGSFEGYGSAWGSIGGGATGGGGDAVFQENDQTVTTDYTIPTGKNASSVGPITINSGASVTISTGSNWAIL